jgi:hypothetical protein
LTHGSNANSGDDKQCAVDTSSTSSSSSSSTSNLELPSAKPAKKTQKLSKAALERQVKRDFEEWWEHYPRKVKKAYAWRCYLKQWKTGTMPLLGDLVKITHKHARYWQRVGRDPEKIPHPSTWLNQESWDDILEIDEPECGVPGFTREEDHVLCVLYDTTPAPKGGWEPVARKEAARYGINFEKLYERRAEWNETRSTG